MDNIKEIYNNEWLSLKSTEDNYIFSHETRCKGKIVSVLGFRIVNNNLEFLGRYEKCPAHGRKLELCSITGGYENNIEEDAIRELKEEAGYDIDKKELIFLGTVRPSKSSDTIVYLFATNLTSKTQGKAEGDGSIGEEGAYSKWINITQLIDCKDPLVHSALVRIMKLLKSKIIFSIN